MTVMAYGVVMDYDSAGDTASVALTGAGIIETWLTGVKIDQPIPRALLVQGMPVTLFLPDVNRLCEAHIVALPQGPIPTTNVPGSTAPQKTVSGRSGVFSGSSITVSYGITFSSPPQVSVVLDGQGVAVLSAVTTTTFTVTFTGGAFWQYMTWSATGPV